MATKKIGGIVFTDSGQGYTAPFTLNGSTVQVPESAYNQYGSVAKAGKALMTGSSSPSLSAADAIKKISKTQDVDMGIAKSIYEYEQGTGRYTADDYAPTTAPAATVKTNDEGVPVESQYTAEMRELRGVIGDIQTFSGELAATFEEQSETYRKSFQDLQKMMGEQTETVRQQLDMIQKQAGALVDITNEQFQSEMLEAQQNGETDFTPIMEKYLVKEGAEGAEVAKETTAVKAPQPATGESPDEFEAIKQVSQMHNVDMGIAREIYNYEKRQAAQADLPDPEFSPGAGYSTDITESASPTQQADEALENISNMSSSSVMTMVEGLGLDLDTMTSSEAMQVMLLSQSMAIADDPTVSDFLERSANYAMSTFEESLRVYGNGGTAVKEIDKAISGKDFMPTTYEGLMAKAQQQSKDLQLESVEAQRDYMKTQQDVWMKQETDNRSRLEGYLKAKLYAVGAQDSSAGLQTMALAVNAADMRLQLKQSEYNYGISQLNVQARSIMNNYANGIVELTLNVEEKKATAESTYNEKMLGIEKELILDNKEKNKLRMEAYTSFTDNMYKIEQDQKTEERFWYQQNYQEAQDAIGNAYQLSGLMGTMHAVDENGNVVDTGIKTIDTKKWEKTYWLDYMQYERSITNDNMDTLFNLIDRGADMGSIANIAGQMGIDPSILSGVTSKDEAKGLLADAAERAKFVGLYSGVMEETSYQDLENNYDGEYTEMGIPDVDPGAFSDIRAALDLFADNITQNFNTKVGYLKGRSTHGGYDITFNDGTVKSFTSGVVTDVIPDPNPGVKSGWGERVIITDGYGRKWQYAHFNNGGSSVVVGDKIGVGQAIGVQGNGGYCISTSGGSGAHLDFRLVGFDSSLGTTGTGQTVSEPYKKAAQYESSRFTDAVSSIGYNSSILKEVAAGSIEKSDYDTMVSQAKLRGDWNAVSALTNVKEGVTIDGIEIPPTELLKYANKVSSGGNEKEMFESQFDDEGWDYGDEEYTEFMNTIKYLL